MGLEESVDEAGDVFITEVYITSAGVKECQALLNFASIISFFIYRLNLADVRNYYTKELPKYKSSILNSERQNQRNYRRVAHADC
jgi:hypothetical protein